MFNEIAVYPNSLRYERYCIGLNGSVKFTEVPMGEFYVVRVEAWDSTFTRVVLRQQIVVFGTLSLLIHV